MKKAISMLLSICMTVSLLCAGGFSFAAQEITQADSAAMQKVLTNVKSKITVPKELDQFTYNIQDNYNGRRWHFQWDDKEGNNLWIDADNQGRIFSFHRYFNNYSITAPQMTKAQAAEKAKTYLKKIAPELSGHVSDKGTCSGNTYDNAYHINFSRVENGLTCGEHAAIVGVRYDTGELISYELNWDFNVKYTAPQKPITEEKARGIWKDALELKLKYNLVYPTSEGENPKAFLAYSPKTQLYPINAETGEAITESFEWIEAGGSGGAEAMSKNAMSTARDEDTGLSAAEIKKASELDGLITVAQADKKLRALPGLVLDSSFKIASSRLYVRNDWNVVKGNNKNTDYSWEITYSGPVTKGDLQPTTVNAQLDAKTGELISYNAYSYGEEKAAKSVINKAGAQTVAETLAKKAAPQKFGETKLNADQQDQGGIIRPMIAEENENQGSINFQYIRQHEKIDFDANYISIDVNTSTGKVSNFHIYWSDDVEFESTDGIIENQNAAELYLAAGKANYGYHIITSYLYDKEGQAKGGSLASTKSYYPTDTVDRTYRSVLAFEFQIISDNISAKTGKLLDYNGKEAESINGVFEGYTDIKGNRAEREITLLGDAGILPQTPEFKPNDVIIQKDYLAFMMKAMNNWYAPLDGQENIENLYQMAENMGIITKAERDPGKKLNRFEAVRFLVRALGFGKLSEDSDLFKLTFNDATSIPKAYAGTAALAKHFLLTDGSGAFSGETPVSRGEAAQLVYRLMNAINKNSSK